MEETNRKLNFLLASLQVQRANLQAVHWNLRNTPHFIEFHAYFGELYDANTGHIDMMAEFVRIYKGEPFITLSRYVRRSKVVEITHEESVSLKAALTKTFNDNTFVLSQIKEIFKDTGESAADINDYMAAMVADFGKRQWFINSCLDRGITEVPVEKVVEGTEEED